MEKFNKKSGNTIEFTRLKRKEHLNSETNIDVFTSLPSVESNSHYYYSIKTLDELLERDKQREEDGFKRKINIGKIIKPDKGGKNKIAVVPTTTEDKFYHDDRVSEAGNDKSGDTGQTTGSADGEEGDVVGERPISQEGQGSGTAGGTGPGEEHEVLSNAYDLGKVLTEQFQLPNLKDKGNKKSFTKFKYDLTDSNRGSGQLLDKHRTLLQVLKTNLALNKFDFESPMINPNDLIINKKDFVYRTLSRERDYEAQAVVFFIRDYSGSMYGKPTELVCSQHLMIFSWLIYQYKNQVESRFILHDTEAKEVKSFNEYYNSNIAGGTRILSAFELAGNIIAEENLAKDYNIYIFYGGDGDDWNTEVQKFNETLKELLSYSNRIGISIIKYSTTNIKSKFEDYLAQNNFLKEELLRLDVIEQSADGNRLIEGIKKLTSEDRK